MDSKEVDFWPNPSASLLLAAHSSDSEDQSVVKGTDKSPASKINTSDMKAAISPKCPGRTPPSSHKYHKQGDPDHTHHREHHGRTPRVYKWSFQMCECHIATMIVLPSKWLVEK